MDKFYLTGFDGLFDTLQVNCDVNLVNSDKRYVMTSRTHSDKLQFSSVLLYSANLSFDNLLSLSDCDHQVKLELILALSVVTDCSSRPPAWVTRVLAWAAWPNYSTFCFVL